MILAIALTRLTGVLQAWEWAALDAGLRLRPEEPLDERVVIVGIEEVDIRQAGQYPIPDQALAQILTQIQRYQPAAIGLDIFRDLPVGTGYAALNQAFQAPNVIGVEKVLPDKSGYTVAPPPGIPAARIGFADAVFDRDGKLRRGLLGTATDQNDYHFSLAVRLTEAFLKPRGIRLDNGVRDPDAMRLGSVELPRLHPNSGGYVGADAGGNQLLLNFRSGRRPFRILSLQDLRQGVNPDWLRGKVVLVGYRAPSVKDIVSSTAIATDTPSLIYGVEIQAHVVSQLLGAVLDGRPLLRTWNDGVEYGWLVVWGLVGLGLGRWVRSPLASGLGLGLASGGLVLGSYGLLLLGWWVPLVPALLGLGINGVVVASFRRYDEALRSRLGDRQMIIDQTFNTIHSGPLQTLAQTLRQLKGDGMPPEQLLANLEQLNQDLRSLYDVVQREALAEDPALYLEANQEFDLQVPLHQTLYEVYRTVLERELPGFRSIKLKVPKFEPLNESSLTTEQKRGLCRFLEEALCNVGKHAMGSTRLEVVCAQVEGVNVIRVLDNGVGLSEEVVSDLTGLQVFGEAQSHGMGTRQAKRLAQQLGGRFERSPRKPQGVCCELVWRARL